MSPIAQRNAIEILRHDHQRMKDLFEAFEDGDSLSEQKQALQTLILELRIHVKRAEEVFYPAVRRSAQVDHFLDQAQEEHLDINTVMEDIEKMEIKDPLFPDKLMELEDKLLTHIQQEESDIFPEAEAVNLDMDDLCAGLYELRDKMTADFHKASLENTLAKPKLKKRTNSSAKK